MNTHDKIELPTLPEPAWVDGEPYWYDRHMEAYARAAIEADRKRRVEPAGYFQNVNSLFPDAEPLYEQVAGEHAGDPDVFPLYAAPQPAEPVTPRTQFEDARAQKVYEIICGDHHPPYGEHWDGYVARLIVDALFPAEPVKPYPVKLYAHGGCTRFHDYEMSDGSVQTLKDDDAKELRRQAKGQPAEPCDMGDMCIGCEPRNRDGSCPDTSPAEPVKVPGDDDVFSRLYEIANRDTAVSVTVRADDLRALLARYGSATDEAIKQQRDIEE